MCYRKIKKQATNGKPCVTVKLLKQNRQEEEPFVMKTVTQTILYRQALIKYAEKYGVTKASIRYKTNRQYIYRCRLWGVKHDIKALVVIFCNPSNSQTYKLTATGRLFLQDEVFLLIVHQVTATPAMIPFCLWWRLFSQCQNVARLLILYGFSSLACFEAPGALTRSVCMILYFHAKW